MPVKIRVATTSMKPQIGAQIAGPNQAIGDLDFNEVINLIGGIGYDCIELTWYPTHYPEEIPFKTYYGQSPEQLKDILGDCNLEIFASHVLLDDLRDHLTDAISFHRKVGCDKLGIVEVPMDDLQSKEAFKEVIQELRDISRLLENAEMKLFVHNHDHEFSVQYNGVPAFAMLVEQIGKEISLQIDLSHVKRSGQDPIAFLEEIEGEVISFHISDMEGTEDVGMGEGEIDLNWVTSYSIEQEIESIIVEEKHPVLAGLSSGEIFDIYEQDYEYLANLV